MKIDIVLQGQYSNFTKVIIDEYKKLDFVGKIILSSYQRIDGLDVDQVINDEFFCPIPGVGNRNLQILTSRAGIQQVTSPYCIKMRTDQLIRLPSMYMMNKFFNDHRQDYRLFVLGMYKDFPYHPRDHVFWGYTTDLMNLFDIPFDTNPHTDYNKNVRAETYIGQYYYANFDSSIEEHIDNPLEFLVDSAPRKHEAMEKDWAIRNNLFVPFPRVSLQWPKHGLNEYHYNVGASLSEYWSD